MGWNNVSLFLWGLIFFELPKPPYFFSLPISHHNPHTLPRVHNMHRYVEFISTSKDRSPIPREIVLRALWDAASEETVKNAPGREELERLVREGSLIKCLSGRYLHVQFTAEFPIVDMQSYDANYGDGAGKAVLDNILEKSVMKQLSLKEFLKRKYDREKAKRTRDRNRKRKAEGKQPYLDSRVRLTNRKYTYTGLHIGKKGKRPRKFKGQHRKKMDEALQERISEGKVDGKWTASQKTTTTGVVCEV